MHRNRHQRVWPSSTQNISASPPLLGELKKPYSEKVRSVLQSHSSANNPVIKKNLQGRPFVGPAGQLLDRAMAEAGIDRGRCYLTNAVKHFKFEQRGKRRMHQKPTAGEVKHYRWWLDRELAFVRPRLIVALGTTAVLALAGKTMPISRVRGEADFAGRRGYVTVHPSYLLRIPDQKAKRQAYGEFVADLRSIRTIASRPRTAPATPIGGRQNRQRPPRAKASP